MTIHQFDIFADYFQLYLMDDEAADDLYKVILWPSDSKNCKSLKRYEST